MSEESQSDYAHAVPKTARPVGPRMNLTFRLFSTLSRVRRAARGARQRRHRPDEGVRMPPTYEDLRDLVTRLTLEEKASLVPRLGLLAHGGGGTARHRHDHGVRRPARAARPAQGGRSRRAGRQRAGHLLPDRLGAGLVVEPRPVRARSARRSAGRRAAGGLGRPRARASTSSGRRCADATSSTSRRTRTSSGALAVAMVRRHPEPGDRHVGQALRRQQPGGRPAPGQRRGRRAHAAGDLPAGLRGGGQAGRSRGR